MFIENLSNSGAAPTLEHLIRFSGQRQRLIAHNIANVSTPDFRPLDVSVGDFRKNLRDAVERRRAATGGERGALQWDESAELRRDGAGELRIEAGTPSGGVLFHDRNNRDLERLMQDSTENVAVFRLATDLLKKHTDLIRSAISQRP